MVLSVLGNAVRRSFLDESQGTIYVTRPMVVLVNIEPKPISTELTKCSVYDRSQDLSTETLPGVRNYNALQLKRVIDGGETVQNDITGEFLSLFHSVVGVVWVVHLLAVGANVVAVDKTEFGKPPLNFTKNSQIIQSCVIEIHIYAKFLSTRHKRLRS